MNATDSLEASIGNALFLNTSPWPSPNGRSTSTAPPPAMTAWAAPRVNGASYAPVRCDPGAERWAKDASQTSGSTVFRNLAPIQYPTATTAWGEHHHRGPQGPGRHRPPRRPPDHAQARRAG
jgi:hypothetical protein